MFKHGDIVEILDHPIVRSWAHGEEWVGTIAVFDDTTREFRFITKKPRWPYSEFTISDRAREVMRIIGKADLK